MVVVTKTPHVAHPVPLTRVEVKTIDRFESRNTEQRLGMIKAVLGLGERISSWSDCGNTTRTELGRDVTVSRTKHKGST